MRILALSLAAGLWLASPGAAQFGRGGGTWQFLAKKYDKNQDGKVTWEEYARDKKKFASLDTDGDGSITKADFGRGRSRRGRGRNRTATRVPKRGDVAPDFELPLAKNAKKTVRLSSFRGKRPVALIFGSHT